MDLRHNALFLGFIDVAGKAGHQQRGKNGQDHQNNDQLHQCKTFLFRHGSADLPHHNFLLILSIVF